MLADDTSEKLLVMYRKEMEVKNTISKNVSHSQSREELMMYSACWMHQPYIDDSATLLLESMLVETGHR